MSRVPSIGAVLLLATLACGVAVAGSETSGIEGEVSIGPVRSVQQKDVPNFRPYQARITVLDASGRDVASVESDADGRFRVALPAGTYTLRPERTGPYPRAPEQQVRVGPGKLTPVRILYDSGRR